MTKGEAAFPPTGIRSFNREMTRPSPTRPGEMETYLATFFPVRTPTGEITGVGGILT